MKISKELMKRAGVLPKLRLAVKKGNATMGTGAHTVRLIEDKIVRGVDYGTGKEVEKVRYIVEESGEKKQYDTLLKSKETGELAYLVQHLSEVPEGTEVTLEFKRAGVKGYIEVLWDGNIEKVESEEETDETVEKALDSHEA